MAQSEELVQGSRLVVIPRLADAFAELYVSECPEGGVESSIALSDPKMTVYQLNEPGSEDGRGDIYNFPMLFHADGLPWQEANSYLLSLVANKVARTRPTDDVRRKASKLLDYLLFCESENIDWTDFSGKRPSLRPTYRYYRHLLEKGGKGGQVVNQYTGIVYDFYKFVARFWHPIDINRVDTVKKLKLMVQGARGNISLDVEKRSQTRPTAPASPVPIGYVRDDGEDLRPLTNTQLSQLLESIYLPSWSAQERLIVLTALMTGARKQTVLTLRLRHLDSFSDENLRPDGTYLIKAGPGTGIDTKFDKEQRVYFPRQLADDLKVWASSPLALRRRKAFLEKMRDLEPGITFDEQDVYVFLSDQGNCYYMAEDDPRYEFVKSRPTGQVTENLKQKLLRTVGSNFPTSFSYHWLRATFAFQLYQKLLPLLKKGRLQYGEEISIIQHRLHHKNRETTENYLKLFLMYSEKMVAQERYEDWLISFGSYSDLSLEELSA
ncbi:site-specific integrase [Pseudomonas aeruginosa]|uniref:site-specific integrase n=1 Tax=Pseudomonas TaxID=286 RepID=UPI0006D452DD|nr:MULTISPECIES: site-specific integrase [Pseudomonas]MDI3815731.1 site-specific integrase [Pseudomonas aeruginosa]MDG9854921.1 site-specific integrase [Pseudomonas nitroreducens]MDI4060117.1 site-specific integrase [Pseudomonas aeruginosa]MDI4168153.1 site-specific integrase [Pseudomonas aeruginosa]OBY89070.1 integrase [Pseudomonas sp. AU11447]